MDKVENVNNINYKIKEDFLKRLYWKIFLKFNRIFLIYDSFVGKFF